MQVKGLHWQHQYTGLKVDCFFVFLFYFIFAPVDQAGIGQVEEGGWIKVSNLWPQMRLSGH